MMVMMMMAKTMSNDELHNLYSLPNILAGLSHEGWNGQDI
jgi:hypothetical protein